MGMFYTNRSECSDSVTNDTYEPKANRDEIQRTRKNTKSRD